MNPAQPHTVAASVTTSVVTAFVALIPGEAFSYAAKLISVLVLAMVAEAGRRLVSTWWDKKTSNSKDSHK